MSTFCHAATRRLGLTLTVCAGFAVSAVAGVERAGIVAANTDFALEVFGRLRSETGNLCFAPLMLTSGLAAAHSGARGETAREIAEAAHFGNFDEYSAALGALLADERTAVPRGNPLGQRWANVICLQRGYGVEPAFVDLVQSRYEARVHEVDFSEPPERATSNINGAIIRDSESGIGTLVGASDFDQNSRLLLASGSFLSRKWATGFDRNHTKPTPFWTGQDVSIDVPAMRQVGTFSYFEADTFEALELPFDDGQLAMLLLLPKSRTGCRGVEARLTRALLEETVNALKPKEMSLALPKLKIGRHYNLTKCLKAMRIRLAFSKRAEFSGLCSREQVQLAAVMHAARVEVSEAGAAEPPSIQIGPLAEATRDDFRADRPFLFLVRNRATGSVHFIGRVADPR